MNNKKNGFTLVELIIVSTILSILSTIAFVNFSGYINKANNTSILSNLNQIEKSLLIQNVTTGKFPIVENSTKVNINGSLLSQFGNIDSSFLAKLGVSKIKDLEKYYYATNSNQKSYQLLGITENGDNLAFSNISFADSDYYNNIGNGVGILTKSGNIIINDVDLILTDSGTTFGVELPSATLGDITGLELVGLKNLNSNNGDYSQPSDCKQGYISVPGNPKYMQPGFCVSKYEMSYSNYNSPDSDTSNGVNDRNTVKYSAFGKLISAEGYFPVTQLSQLQAINSCASIGQHLVTMSEWMTIANNIENVSQNWSNGAVGDGYLKNGLSGSQFGCGGIANDNYPSLSRNYGAKTGPSGVTGSGILCDEKRQLKLNNGEVIWDFAGNVREYVNKYNLTDGSLYNYGNFTLGTTTNTPVSWYSSGITNPNGLYGPDIQYNNYVGGLGDIYYAAGNTQNVGIRGGGDEGPWESLNPDEKGIYSIRLDWRYTYLGTSFFGFRCAY